MSKQLVDQTYLKFAMAMVASKIADTQFTYQNFRY